MVTPIDNSQTRKQWLHQKQFGHKLEALRPLGLRVESEQMRQLYLTDGVGFMAVDMEDPSLELDGPIVDANGNYIILPWMFEFTVCNYDLYRSLDDMYAEGWRTWPSFTGWMEPKGGCFDEQCYRCNDREWYSEELAVAVPVWDAMIFLDLDEAAAVRNHVYEQLNNTNYAEWFHFWCERMWGPENKITRLSEPDDPLVMQQITMPTAELQQRWDAMRESSERNRQLCREIEHREYVAGIEYDRQAIARRERMDAITKKTG